MLGSIVLLAAGLEGLTRSGWWVVAIVADIVLVFAVLQARGLNKIRHAATA